MITRTILAFALLLSWAIPAISADRITVQVIVTNAPIVSDSIVINGTDTRTWATASSSTTIQTNANLLSATTNLWLHFGSYPSAGVTVRLASSNEVQFIGLPGAAMGVAIYSNAWAQVILSTQAVTSAQVVRVPMSVEATAVRTNMASQLARDLEAYSPTAFGTGTTLLSAYVDKSTSQTVTGAKIFSSITTTGLVNHGSAIRSIGSGTDSEQFGSGAVATNTEALAVGKDSVSGGVASSALGNSATATGAGALALGYSTTASKDDALSVGTGSSASGTNSIAVGSNAAASGSDSIGLGTGVSISDANSIGIGGDVLSAGGSTVLGYGSQASGTDGISIGQANTITHDNVTVIGTLLTSTADNQVLLGDSSQLVQIAGRATASSITNTTYYGTIGLVTGGLISGSTLSNSTVTAATVTSASHTGMALTRNDHTTLATGANSGVVFTNVFNKIASGPGGAFSIAGIAGGSNGRMLIVYNSTAHNMTVSHDSGTEATAANRIYTMTGADVATTAAGTATFVYDSGASRWILIDYSP